MLGPEEIEAFAEQIKSETPRGLMLLGGESISVVLGGLLRHGLFPSASNKQVRDFLRGNQGKYLGQRLTLAHLGGLVPDTRMTLLRFFHRLRNVAAHHIVENSFLSPAASEAWGMIGEQQISMLDGDRLNPDLVPDLQFNLATPAAFRQTFFRVFLIESVSTLQHYTTAVQTDRAAHLAWVQEENRSRGTPPG